MSVHDPKPPNPEAGLGVVTRGQQKPVRPKQAYEVLRKDKTRFVGPRTQDPARIPARGRAVIREANSVGLEGTQEGRH